MSVKKFIGTADLLFDDNGKLETTGATSADFSFDGDGKLKTTGVTSADFSFDGDGKLETMTDLSNENALGEIPVTSPLVGNSRPDVLYWASGTDSYAAAATGAITAVRRRALVYNNGNACLLSIADTAAAEVPYLIPDEFVREIVFPFEIAIGAAITIKNLETGVNAGKIWIEFA